MIKDIFKNYLNIKLNDFLIDNRNIIFCIFIAQIELNEPHLINYEFCNYNYPPLQDFINKKKYDIKEIRYISYKCCQYNINISNIITDLLKNKYLKDKHKIIKIGAELDILLSNTNKKREPLYIENLLCQLLL